jgi:hypothetical protein
MSGTPIDPDRDQGTDAGADRGTMGMPRWVKISLIIAIVLAAALIVSLLLGVQHGPGLHEPSGGSGGLSSTLMAGEP